MQFALTVVEVAGDTTRDHIINLAYLVAIVLFIVGLRKLTHPNTARQGNQIAGVGMFIASSAPCSAPRSASSRRGRSR